MSLSARFRIQRPAFVLEAEIEAPGRGVTALFGPSGSGKTTLLRAIAGLDRHPGGELKFGGEVWQSGHRFLPVHRRSVGYVFQEASLFPHRSVAGNLDYAFSRVPADGSRIALQRVIDLMGIGHLLDRHTTQLSGGERQRVAIARALAAHPRLLLMDEPLVGLDIASKQELMPYIEALHRELEIPVIYVSHSVDEVARLADHLVLMDQGGIVATGEVHEMFTRLDIPLAQGLDAASLIDATVALHDDEFQLTRLDFAGGSFHLPRESVPIGTAVRVKLSARDVSLTLDHQSGTSILNIFPAHVDAMVPSGPAQLIVRLRAGGIPLLARITRKSATNLGLQPGMLVYAQAKSVALLS